MSHNPIDLTLSLKATALAESSTQRPSCDVRTTSFDPSIHAAEIKKNNQRIINQRDHSRIRASQFPFTIPFAQTCTDVAERDRFQNSFAKPNHLVPVTCFYQIRNALKNAHQLWLANSGCDRMNVLPIANNTGGLAGKQGKNAASDSN